MSSKKKLPAFHRHRDPPDINKVGGPIVDLIAMLDDVPAAKRSPRLVRLAKSYLSGEGVYSILTPKGRGSSLGPQHTYISLVVAMCTLASPAVLAQWNTIVLDEALSRSGTENTRPAMALVSDALEAYRPDIALDMLEHVANWHALQPRPHLGTGLLRSDQGRLCVGGLIAQMPDAPSQRQRLLDVITRHVNGPNGYFDSRMSDLTELLADPAKNLHDGFVDTALRNAMSPEFAPHVKPEDLVGAALNRCSPEALSYALQFPKARTRLAENIDAVLEAIKEFVYACGVNASRNDDLGKFEQVIVVLLGHGPEGFPSQLLDAVQSSGPSLPDGGRDHLVSLIEKNILNHNVASATSGTSPGPRF